LWLVAGVKIRGSGEVKCYLPLKGRFVPMNIGEIKESCSDAGLFERM
jgi:hypothetical protein